MNCSVSIGDEMDIPPRPFRPSKRTNWVSVDGHFKFRNSHVPLSTGDVSAWILQNISLISIGIGFFRDLQKNSTSRLGTENCGIYPHKSAVNWYPRLSAAVDNQEIFARKNTPFRSNDSIQLNLVENGEEKSIHFWGNCLVNLNDKVKINPAEHHISFIFIMGSLHKG